MKLSATLAVLVFSLRLLGQDAPGKVSKIHTSSWSVAAAYVQPLGRWTHEAMLYTDGHDGPTYIESFGGKGGVGMHTHFGLNFTIGYQKTFYKTGSSKLGLDFVYDPAMLEMIRYDLEEHTGPAVISSDIHPLFQYEMHVGLGISYKLNTHSLLSLYCKAGPSLKKTSGEINYDSNTRERIEYSYRGAGAVLVPGIRYETHGIGIGAEFHLETADGSYSQSLFVKDASGVYYYYSPVKSSYATGFNTFNALNVLLSYSF